MESKASRSTHWTAALPAIVIPVCIGMSMYFGLSALIQRGVVADETLLRYLTGHPISHVTVAMFLIGLGSLMMIGWNVTSQFRGLDQVTLRETSQDSEQEKTSIDELQSRLVELPSALHPHYLWKRLYEALQFVSRTKSTSGFEDELKYLSDVDADRQQQRYSLVRILVWATPMLGFLGTVLGISQALGGIQVGPENDFSQMMGSLRSSLYVAFDTTALALSLSMILMFVQFFVDRFETQLLRAVDQRARRDLVQHLSMDPAKADPTIELKQTVLETSAELVERQADLWRKSIQAAEKAWIESLSGVSQQVRDNLTESLDHSVHCLADYLGQAIRRADVSMSHRWHQWQVSLSENVRTLREYYAELTKQTQLISELLKTNSGDGQWAEALRRSEEALAATETLTNSLDQMIGRVNEPEQVADAQPAILSQDSSADEINELKDRSSASLGHSSTVKSNVNWEYFRQPIVLDGVEPDLTSDNGPQIFRFMASNTETAAQSEKKAA